MMITGPIAASQQMPDIVCPIMHNAVTAESPAIEYRGLQIRFCCDGCDDTFKSAPEKALADAAKENRAVAISLFNPITQMRLEQKDAKAYIDYGGIRWPLDSAEQKEEFLFAPEIYASAPDQEALFCPVMKNEIGAHSQASGFADHNGVRYYFCCAGCDATFKAEPEMYVDDIADKVRPVGGESAMAAPKKRTLAPTCAGCAGEARLLADGQLASQWTASYRFINIDDDAARNRFTLDYRVTPRVSLGLEANGDGEGILPRGSWFITPEGENHPSLVLGFTADRLSTPRGHAVFLTASKSIPNSPVLPFLSVKLNTDDGATYFPFGANWMINDRHTLQVINDGSYTHMLLTHIGDQANFSLILARMKHLGFSVNYAF